MKREFSAGGVVYKKQDNTIFILVAQHSQHHGWVFPKGLIGDNIKNESKEETALREVKEETGVDGTILKTLTPVTYWYQFKKERIKKTVYFYLMKYIRGDIAKHDNEMENVEWIAKEQVINRLTYLSDKNVWEEAEKHIR